MFTSYSFGNHSQQQPEKILWRFHGQTTPKMKLHTALRSTGIACCDIPPAPWNSMFTQYALGGPSSPRRHLGFQMGYNDIQMLEFK